MGDHTSEVIFFSGAFSAEEKWANYFVDAFVASPRRHFWNPFKGMGGGRVNLKGRTGETGVV